jgi:hypothetical protein
MRATLRTLFLCLAGLIAFGVQASEDFVVIGHAGVPKVDAPTLQRLYTGRAIEIAGTAVTVLNAAPDSPVRAQFLLRVVNLDNERYIAYWTVRRHVGKGAPPREFHNTAELIDHVQATPGALGYIAAGDLKPGMNVVFRPVKP